MSLIRLFTNHRLCSFRSALQSVSLLNSHISQVWRSLHSPVTTIYPPFIDKKQAKRSVTRSLIRRPMISSLWLLSPWTRPTPAWKGPLFRRLFYKPRFHRAITCVNMKNKIQNNKSQTISNYQNSKFKTVLNFGHLNLEFVWDLRFRIWNLFQNYANNNLRGRILFA